jgi:hypothetical protein
MSADYPFNITVNKAPALASYLKKNFSIPVSISINSGAVVITTQSALSEADLATLTSLMNAYVDPDVFYQLNHTEPNAGVSQTCNSVTYQDVQSIIFPSNTNQADGTVLNSMKAILQISGTMSDFADLGTGSVNIRLFDYTRQVLIGSQTIDVSDILTSWQAIDNGAATGFKDPAYKCFMFCDLHASSTNYDCIWTFQVSVSDARIYTNINGLQKLFYDAI